MVKRLTSPPPPPFLSVMIPTYNCAHYLRQTLQSILSQDPGPETMEIVVVDDVSRDNPESVVREMAGDRVRFYQHEQNKGATENFNACLNMARGQWVHILHGDDFVDPGFYEAIRVVIDEVPQAGMIVCNHLHVNERNEVIHTPAQVAEKSGLLEDFAVPLACYNYLQFASVVARRDVYDQVGHFNPQLIHCADHEMWVGLALATPVAFSSRALARYRIHAGADTSRLRRNAGDIRDIYRYYQGIPQLFARADAKTIQDYLRQLGVVKCLGNALGLLRQADPVAAARHLAFSFRFEPNPLRYCLTLARITGRVVSAVLRPNRVPLNFAPTTRHKMRSAS